jgi:hypothetical protein
MAMRVTLKRQLWHPAKDARERKVDIKGAPIVLIQEGGIRRVASLQSGVIVLPVGRSEARRRLREGSEAYQSAEEVDQKA